MTLHSHVLQQHKTPSRDKATGTKEEIKEQFRQVREQIKGYSKKFYY
jgi:hypothetical protein